MTSSRLAGIVTLSDLTPRQRQIAELLAQGLTRPAIAMRLAHPGIPVSVRTIDSHIRAIATQLPHDDLPASRRVRKWACDQLRTCVRTY